MADSIDNGFNDSELEDIMSEIESLEKEYVEDTPAEQHHEVKAGHDEEIEEAQIVEEKVVPISKPTSGNPCHSKMDFSVAGDMKMQLNFTVAGQVVSVHVDEENGFRIEMEGGATFSLPLGDHKKVG